MTMRFVLVAALCAAGCSGSHEPDVYVAGWESNGSVAVARLWRNGRAQDLSDGVHGAIATGVAISGADVYVSGCTATGSSTVATYWMNGDPVALTDGSSPAVAEAVAVSGRDVYVAGQEASGGATIAKVWRNGAPTSLTDGSRDADALAIAVSGSDVYVAGFERMVTEIAPGVLVATSIAKLWKNGVATVLSEGESAAASSVALEGSDVYVAGWVVNGSVLVATVWKNGVQLSLTDGTYGSLGTGVAVAQGGLQVSGSAYDGNVDVARVWRDGAPTDLTSPDRQGAGQPSLANAVTAVRGDSYAAGHRGRAAVYWKNGAEVALTDGSSDADARAIAVVVH